jgi:hypothetical protein
MRPYLVVLVTGVLRYFAPVIFLLLIIPSVSRTTIIFDNGSPLAGAAGAYSDADGLESSADDFILAAPYVVNRIIA